eukprot:SAG22_NODE_120_length_19227_cov_7.584013_7_plen_231_part_00
MTQTWRVFGDHHGIWVGGGGTKDVINQSAYLAPEFTGKPYGWNDLDMLETGNGGWAKGSNQSAVEYRTEFSMWAILASPMVVTTPLYNMAGCDDTSCNGRCQDCRDQDKGKPVNGKPHCLNGRQKCTAKCEAGLTPVQQQILLNTDVIAINQVRPAGGKRREQRAASSEQRAAGRRGDGCLPRLSLDSKHRNSNVRMARPLDNPVPTRLLSLCLSAPVPPVPPVPPPCRM